MWTLSLNNFSSGQFKTNLKEILFVNFSFLTHVYYHSHPNAAYAIAQIGSPWFRRSIWPKRIHQFLTSSLCWPDSLGNYVDAWAWREGLEGRGTGRRRGTGLDFLYWWPWVSALTVSLLTTGITKQLFSCLELNSWVITCLSACAGLISLSFAVILSNSFTAGCMMVVVALLSCIVSKPAKVLRGAVRQLESKHWISGSTGCISLL